MIDVTAFALYGKGAAGAGSTNEASGFERKEGRLLSTRFARLASRCARSKKGKENERELRSTNRRDRTIERWNQQCQKVLQPEQSSVGPDSGQ